MEDAPKITPAPDSALAATTMPQSKRGKAKTDFLARKANKEAKARQEKEQQEKQKRDKRNLKNQQKRWAKLRVENADLGILPKWDPVARPRTDIEPKKKRKIARKKFVGTQDEFIAAKNQEAVEWNERYAERKAERERIEKLSKADRRAAFLRGELNFADKDEDEDEDAREDDDDEAEAEGAGDTGLTGFSKRDWAAHKLTKAQKEQDRKALLRTIVCIPPTPDAASIRMAGVELERLCGLRTGFHFDMMVLRDLPFSVSILPIELQKEWAAIEEARAKIASGPKGPYEELFAAWKQRPRFDVCIWAGEQREFDAIRKRVPSIANWERCWNTRAHIAWLAEIAPGKAWRDLCSAFLHKRMAVGNAKASRVYTDLARDHFERNVKTWHRWSAASGWSDLSLDFLRERADRIIIPSEEVLEARKLKRKQQGQSTPSDATGSLAATAVPSAHAQR